MSDVPTRVLVTGGAGFIGSNLVDALVDAGTMVTVLDDLSTGRRENLRGALDRGALLVEGDIRDAEGVAAASRDTQAILHLAAQVDVRRAVSDPVLDAEINVQGTINVLETARRQRMQRVVLVSTGGAIYGEADELPTTEAAPERPLSPYGLSKLCGEAYADLYARLHGISTVALRLANVYGARQDPLGEGGVVAIFCGRALAGDSPTVFGDGSQTRDFLHVDDVVEALQLALATQVTGTVNVGTGRETSVLELIEALRPYARGAWEPVLSPARSGEVRRSVLDPSRARVDLGWRPRTTLSDGLQRTLDSQTTLARLGGSAGP